VIEIKEKDQYASNDQKGILKKRKEKMKLCKEQDEQQWSDNRYNNNEGRQFCSAFGAFTSGKKIPNEREPIKWFYW